MVTLGVLAVGVEEEATEGEISGFFLSESPFIEVTALLTAADGAGGDFLVWLEFPGEMHGGDDLMLRSGDDVGMLTLIFALPG